MDVDDFASEKCSLTGRSLAKSSSDGVLSDTGAEGSSTGAVVFASHTVFFGGDPRKATAPYYPHVGSKAAPLPTSTSTTSASSPNSVGASLGSGSRSPSPQQSFAPRAAPISGAPAYSPVDTAQISNEHLKSVATSSGAAKQAISGASAGSSPVLPAPGDNSSTLRSEHALVSQQGVGTSVNTNQSAIHESDRSQRAVTTSTSAGAMDARHSTGAVTGGLLPSAASGGGTRRYGCTDVSEYRVLGASVGKGMYGEVSRAVDREGARVALKKMGVAKEERDGFPMSALREIKALRALAGHANVVTLRDVAEGRPSFSKTDQATASAAGSGAGSGGDGQGEGKQGGAEGQTLTKAQAAAVGPAHIPGDLYLVLDFYEGSLHGLLNMPEAVRTYEHVRVYMGQLLAGLAHMHSRGYCHRDIKPANLLMHPDHTLAIADFGLANRWKPGAFMTAGVVTLWYRAPELLLGEVRTGPPLDVWSAGVVLLELLTGYPIHRKDSTNLAIQEIWALCGSASNDSWGGVEKLPYWEGGFKPRKRYTRNIKGKFHKSIPPLALDLLDRLLVLNPAARPTAAQALSHPFFARPAYEQPGVGEETPPVVLPWGNHGPAPPPVAASPPAPGGGAAAPPSAGPAPTAQQATLHHHVYPPVPPFPIPAQDSLPPLPFTAFHENDAKRVLEKKGHDVFAARPAVAKHPMAAAADMNSALAAGTSLPQPPASTTSTSTSSGTTSSGAAGPGVVGAKVPPTTSAPAEVLPTTAPAAPVSRKRRASVASASEATGVGSHAGEGSSTSTSSAAAASSVHPPAQPPAKRPALDVDAAAVPPPAIAAVSAPAPPTALPTPPVPLPGPRPTLGGGLGGGLLLGKGPLGGGLLGRPVSLATGLAGLGGAAPPLLRAQSAQTLLGAGVGGSAMATMGGGLPPRPSPPLPAPASLAPPLTRPARSNSVDETEEAGGAGIWLQQ